MYLSTCIYGRYHVMFEPRYPFDVYSMWHFISHGFHLFFFTLILVYLSACISGGLYVMFEPRIFYV